MKIHQQYLIRALIISYFTKKSDIKFSLKTKKNNNLYIFFLVKLHFNFFFIDDNSPKAPPRRRDRSNRRSSPTGMLSASTISSSSTLSSEPAKPQPMSNGLPPTPKVHMGACFSKVYLVV